MIRIWFRNVIGYIFFLVVQNNLYLIERRLIMTNKNDNRERKNKYPNNVKNDVEFSKETSIRSEIPKKNVNK